MAPSDRAAEPSEAAAPAAPAEVSVAYFAGGCFWGVEHYMQEVDGVLAVEAGYMGGHVDSPSYEEVAAQTSGHLETVEVKYNPAQVGYEVVAQRFFEIHDPTQADGQGPDIGPEYRSAVFVSTPQEREVVESLIARLKAKGYGVVTEIRETEKFFRAEDHHQDYYSRTGKKPYCHARVRRFDEGVSPEQG